MSLKKVQGTAFRACLGVLLSGLLFVPSLLAQQGAARHITGKITSQTTGTPIPGATITVQKTRNSVKADDNGEVSIQAAPGESLLITNIGFTPKEVKVGVSLTLNVSLAQDYNHLEDVVVVGYGRMKKTDLSSAVVTISNADL